MLLLPENIVNVNEEVDFVFISLLARISSFCGSKEATISFREG